MKNILAISALVASFGVAAAEQAPAERKVAPAPKPTAPVKTDPVVAPPAAEMPKPPAEIETFSKMVAGKWKCTGMAKGMDGKDEKMTVTVTTKLDLDKWWISDTIDVKMGKWKEKLLVHSTYDAKSSKWRRVSVGSSGAQSIGSSDGLKDNKVIFTNDVMGPMGSMQMREITDLTNAKAPVFSGESSMDKGKTWSQVYSVTCKK